MKRARISKTVLMLSPSLRASLMTTVLCASLATTARADRDWWSLRELTRPPVPELTPEEAASARTPVDAFILSRHREEGLSLSVEADRKTLIRRLYFELIGLPPPPEEVNAFVHDGDSRAYENLVDRLLASARHGERWARHWLDVVHYGDTHGYDKDKLRPNAWPYRDYVIRSFNGDKPYTRFVEEQLAGDVLFPGTTDGIIATGFIAAGPWDYIGHAEVPATKIDGKVARNLDRDDMVSTTISTFVSMTVGCARCHDHKFDPVTQEDYYSLQAVFAAIDRADRPYDVSPEIARRRAAAVKLQQELTAKKKTIEESIRKRADGRLVAVERELEALETKSVRGQAAAFGYHSQIEKEPDVTKWVQVDLGEVTAIEHIRIVGCHDDFNGIGAGFGFPPRFKIEISSDADFASGVEIVEDRSGADTVNPGVTPFAISGGGRKARFVRVTATKLALRQNDYIFALAELSVLGPNDEVASAGAVVSSLDTHEAPVRWQRQNLVDGYYYGVEDDPETSSRIAELEGRRQALLDSATDAATRAELASVSQSLERASWYVNSLPAQGVVYAGCVHHGSGPFLGTGHDGGKPREIRILNRGKVTSPGERVGPGTVPIIPGVEARFDLPEGHKEGARRVALVRWIVDRRNPLTWRSIVNRIWQYHFGRGLVDSPNDFGRMGQRPTHPELLDWLAVEFRDGGQSFKKLHRLILTSAVYRQTSAVREDFAQIDGGNRFLWRMNRRRLEAESIRDAVLVTSGKLNQMMFGPGFRAFVLERPEHSPHYEYHKHDPDDPDSHRRSIYRFIVRSQPDPFMETLDCADPSQFVDKRNETLTALQALALLNDKFMLLMAGHFADRLLGIAEDLPSRIDTAYRLTVGRSPTADEMRDLEVYAKRFGLENLCRVLFNLNEFVFVD